MHTINIYRGSTLIAQVERDTFKWAWQDGVKYVREMAHCEGVEGEARIEAPRGRGSYGRGFFRAVSQKMCR